MNKKIRLTFYHIFLLCAFFCIVFFSKVNSFANPVLSVQMRKSVTPGYEYLPEYVNFSVTNYNNSVPYRYCFYYRVINNVRWNYMVYPYGYYPTLYVESVAFDGTRGTYTTPPGETVHSSFGDVIVCPTRANTYQAVSNPVDCSINCIGGYIFDNFNDAAAYVMNGTLPQLPYDDTLKLDSFKVSSWGLGTTELAFNSKFDARWSDSRISTVQVRIEGPNRIDTFEGSSSPFKGKFKASNYVNVNGDVIHVTATPYKSDGTYGKSLYYTFIYDDNIPFSNVYRKFFNTPYSDNTLTIPYTGVSGNGDGTVTAPVDYVTTNNNYEVHYNPTTNEYTDIYLTEIYYSPVIVYPTETPEDIVDDTQDTIINEYTTNNYYETTKNINVDFDVSFGDVSTGDIQIGYDNFGGFINGIGGLVTKLASWINALFPFISPTVAATIVIVFGLVTLLAIVVFALKIADVIADFLDIIVPL